MHLEHTIAQLDVGFVPSDKAIKMGHLGYMQWLEALPTDADYLREAMHAYETALPFIRTSPAVTVFCHLLVTSAASPLQPLELDLPPRKRRGGAKARRGTP